MCRGSPQKAGRQGGEGGSGGPAARQGSPLPTVAAAEPGRPDTVPFAAAMEQVPAALAEAVGGRVYSCPPAGSGIGHRHADSDDPLDFATVSPRGDRLLLPAHADETRAIVDFEGHGRAEYSLNPINGECRVLSWTRFSTVQGFVVDAAGSLRAGVQVGGCGGTDISGPDGSFMIDPALVGTCQVGVLGCDGGISHPVRVEVGPDEDVLDVRIVVGASALAACPADPDWEARDCASWRAARTRKIVEATALARSSPPEGEIFAELARELEAADEETRARCGNAAPAQ